MKFVGRDETGKRMDAMELDADPHPFYVGVQVNSTIRRTISNTPIQPACP
jgi:CTP synthase (UTP-ammonia lyase)